MDITPEIVRELLLYNPLTGVFTWRSRGDHWFKTAHSCRAWNTRLAGKRAGRYWADARGYRCRRVCLLGIEYLEHRLAWMWMLDDPLPSEIDHDNQDGTDNRWVNLFPSSRIKNQHNAHMNKNNTSGVTGVVRHIKTGRWHARGMVNGKRVHLGLFDEIDEAAMAVMEFRKEQNFSPRHGMRKRSP